jgi:hypothetical protein
MTAPQSDTKSATASLRLPRRDWILMPAISLLTVGLIAVTTELTARALLPEVDDEMGACLVRNDASTGLRGVPNSDCFSKIPEGKMVEYRFNSRGDYSDHDPFPKPAGAFRIALQGSSFAMGGGVPRADTFAVLLPKELTNRTGREVELYNEGLPRRTPHRVALRIDGTLALKPDMILWTFTYADVRTASQLTTVDVPDYVSGYAAKSANQSAHSTPLWKKLRAKVVQAGVVFAHAVNDKWRGSRSMTLLIDMLAAIESQDQMLARNRTSEAQYLDAVPSAPRLEHLKDIDTYVGEVVDRAKSAGVPVVGVFLPGRLPAAYVSAGHWPSDMDPFSLDNELREIFEAHGGIYLDILPYFRTIRNGERYYFPADGHPTPEGNALIADMLARELTSGKVPNLTSGSGSVEVASSKDQSGTKIVRRSGEGAK